MPNTAVDMSPQISIVIPLYNESEAFPHLVKRLDQMMDSVALTVEVILVDDGSRDDTAPQIYVKALADKRYQGVFLSRNFGHQQAISAGLTYARGTEACMIIDGDLQDPPEMLVDFYKQLQEGYDVIYGIRKSRKESWLKRLSFYLYYRIQRHMAVTSVSPDSGDFSMISRRVIDIINTMPEESRYLRGMRSWIGFRQIGIPYEREHRVAGKSKYSWKMLFRLAYNGIFNFSNIPLKFLTYSGAVMIVIALGYLLHTLHKKFILHETPEGFTGLLFTIVLFGGVQLIGMGILGEYISRIFFQVKGRPLYIVRERISDRKVI